MWVTGHVAAGCLVAMWRWPVTRAQVTWCVLGALLPDLVDKGLKLVGWTPYGRSVGHAAAVCAVGVGVALLCRGRGVKWPWWLASGWLSHLVTDLADDMVAGCLFHGYVFSAWMGWPWWTPDEGAVRVAHVLTRSLDRMTPLEWALMAGALWWSLRGGRRQLSEEPG